jgi:hypothetical protein
MPAAPTMNSDRISRTHSRCCPIPNFHPHRLADIDISTVLFPFIDFTYAIDPTLTLKKEDVKRNGNAWKSRNGAIPAHLLRHDRILARLSTGVRSANQNWRVPSIWTSLARFLSGRRDTIIQKSFKYTSTRHKPNFRLCLALGPVWLVFCSIPLFSKY